MMSSTLCWMSSTLSWVSSTFSWMSSSWPAVASEVPAGACPKADAPRPNTSKVPAIRTLKKHIGAFSIGDRDVLERRGKRRVIVDLFYLGRRGRIFGEPGECAALGDLGRDPAAIVERVRERYFLALPKDKIFLVPSRNVILIVICPLDDSQGHFRITGVAKPHADRKHAGAVALALHNLRYHTGSVIDVLCFRNRTGRRLCGSLGDPQRGVLRACRDSQSGGPQSHHPNHR